MTSILKFKFNDCPGSFAQERERERQTGRRGAEAKDDEDEEEGVGEGIAGGAAEGMHI